MPALIIRRGPQAGKVIELTQDIIYIGRGAKNDLIIDDNDVSREHCQLVRVDGGYELRDLNSTNGTFVNGQRVTSARTLHGGQLIELGDMITLEYQRDLAESAPNSEDAALSARVTPIIPGDTFALVVEIGPNPRRIYTLTEDNYTLGRDLSNDIVIQDPEVSRWHLQLFRNPDGYSVKDMGSTNGTVLNGVRLTGSKPLRVYDTLELGTAVRLHYIYDTEEARNRVTVDAEPDPELASDRTEEKRDTKELIELQFARRRKTSRLGTGVNRGALVDHVFIAYAREDWEELVAPLTLALQDAGVKNWVDQYLMQGSDDWQVAIEQALHECWLMLLVLSPDALESRYVRLAFRYFINREKPVIPLAYKPVEALPTELSGLETLPYDASDPRRSYQRLIHVILDRHSQ
ncbi:MAG TPA: FHA domain-containing protein [Spirillospora sp.]|nr:FHA domain-containing protein [Spirillospora sp.]